MLGSICSAIEPKTAEHSVSEIAHVGWMMDDMTGAGVDKTH